MSCAGDAVLLCVAQVDGSPGRRGRDTGSYLDRGERREAPHGRRTKVADSRRRTLGRAASRMYRYPRSADILLAKAAEVASAA